jgi:hypothetical protein
MAQSRLSVLRYMCHFMVGTSPLISMTKPLFNQTGYESNITLIVYSISSTHFL